MADTVSEMSLTNTFETFLISKQESVVQPT